MSRARSPLPPPRESHSGARRLLRLLTLAGALGACGEPPPDRKEPAKGTLLVFAAADLQRALGEVVDRYAEATGRRPDVVFGSTGNLTAQIENGAPADLFFAANEGFLDRLAAQGMIAEDSRRVYALGRLALVWSGSHPPPKDLRQLAGLEYRTIAIANPEHAPYGAAAREALQATGAWDRVKEKVVYGENIAQTYQFVQSGNADAGLVALGLVLGREPRPHIVIPDSLHRPLRQAAAVIRASVKGTEAREFLAFVTGPGGRAILGRYGFIPPE